MLVFDVLVVGGGGAGMRAAIEAAKTADVSVALLSQISPLRSTTGCTGGGINALLPQNPFGDTHDQYVKDTLAGSSYLADPSAVEFFVERTADAINELNEYGVPFLRTTAGSISQRKGGGAAYPRICVTNGHSIAHMMYEKLLRTHVHELTGLFLWDIVTRDEEVCGVVCFDTSTGQIVPVSAKSLVVATGGYGRIYWNRTTTPVGVTGDGIAACLKAGIGFKDPEFVQFNPTALAESGILISEAARSAGAHLLNANGERFLARYAPEAMELATRDVVSIAIENEIRAGRGHGKGSRAYVLLDLRHLGEKKIREKLAQIHHTALTFAGVDPVSEPIPIQPGAHYVMGGIDVVDFRSGATEIKGVFAAGECSCVSIHGANRLGGNGLSELLVFGKAAGASAAKLAKKVFHVQTEAVVQAAEKCRREFGGVSKTTNFSAIVDIRNRMSDILWSKAGIVRNEMMLKSAKNEMQILRDEYSALDIKPTGAKGDNAFIQGLELGNMLSIGEAVIQASLQRNESRGAHYREDFPATNEKMAVHSLVKMKQGKCSIEYQPLKRFINGGR